MLQHSSPTNRRIMNERVIIFIDLDCYEVQVWLKEFRPDLIGKDVPVVVTNHDQRILSVNYSAKSLGVERGDWESLHDARSKCGRKGKDLVELEAGERFGKVDSFLPQVESDKILKALQIFQANLGRKSSSIIIERSSRDEFYIDVTALVQAPNSFSSFKLPSGDDILQLTNPRKRNPNEAYLGKPTTIMETSENSIFGPQLFNRIQVERMKYIVDQEELSLVNGAIIAQKIMKIIRENTRYEASAGIAHSKLMAKLACSRNKPEGITIITKSSHKRLQRDMDFQDLPGFGSVIGSRVKEHLNKRNHRQNTVYTIDQLLRATNEGADFGYIFEKLDISDAVVRADQLLDFCHFQDDSQVLPVVHQKKFRTSISFKGNDSWDDFKDKIKDLSADMENRITYNNDEGRRAQELVVKAKMFDGVGTILPTDLGNTMQLERNPSWKKIYWHIRDYCSHNHLNYRDICNVSLTAKNIVFD